LKRLQNNFFNFLRWKINLILFNTTGMPAVKLIFRLELRINFHSVTTCRNIVGKFEKISVIWNSHTIVFFVFRSSQLYCR